MLWIQFILIVGIVLAAALLVRGLSGEKSLAIKRLFALLGVVVAVLAIIFPSSLTVVAHAVGIGRGTDLLLYLFIVGALVFAVSVIRAKARSDARVTRLARAVALMEARITEAQHGEAQRAEAPQHAEAPQRDATPSAAAQHADPQHADPQRDATRGTDQDLGATS